jgi:uncharacterized protein (DUF2267 family)
MEHDRFISIVEQTAELDRETAVRVTRATLETLAERLSAGEARDLAPHLPDELAPWLATSSGPEPVDLAEFLRRVAERAGVELPLARRAARVVFIALERAVPREELADLVAELPEDFGPLLRGAGPHGDVVPAEAFLQRVAERAGLNVEGARRATETVLETLAERIAGGEVDDLISQLPVELHPPLERGRALGDGAARRLSLDAFLRHVAEREGVTPAEARVKTGAVLQTLREAVTDEEFFDVTVQLPEEYAELLSRS